MQQTCIAILIYITKLHDTNLLICKFSILGHTGPVEPESNMYFTTKQAVRVLTEAHRMELRKRKSNIRVTVCLHVKYFLSKQLRLRLIRCLFAQKRKSLLQI